MRTKGEAIPFHTFTCFLTILVLLSSCIAKNDVEIKLKNPKSKNNETVAPLPPVTVSNVQVVNHQIIITGTNLASVSQFQIKEGSTNTNLQIESKTANQIVANTLSNVTFAAGKILDFILSNAEAASTFTVNFSLCDSTLGGKGFNCSITPNDKEVLSYDATSGKWKPRAVNGLSYQGSWDALNDPQPTTASAGDYFIVSVASAPYSVGDWIVYNGTSYDHINNSSAITTVFGRTGVVTANEADYVLDKMGDVDLITTPAITGDFLRFNGTKWVPAVIPGGNPGTVTNVSASGPLSVTNGTSTPSISISQATTLTNGYLTSTDWNTFNNKQPAITAGTTAQYYRGDKTWQTLDTLAVSENTNLYFTNARALGVPLTGFSANNAAIAATDTILQAFGKAQGQIDNLTTGGSNYIVKNGNDTVTGVVNFNTIGALSIGYTPTNLTDATSKSYVDAQRDSRVAKSGDTMSGDLQINTVLKLKDSGSNTVSLQAPTTIGTSYVLRLPVALGSNNQVLTTDAAGNLSWTTPASSLAPNGSAGGDLSGSYPNPTITALNATKVGGGAVDNTEFSYLDGVTGSIQTQLNSKLSSFTETDPGVSAFAKAALPTCAAGEVLKANGTTLSCVADNSGAGAYSGGNNFVVVTNGSGALSDSTVTTTELGRLTGVTSNIQTQLNAKQTTIDKNTTQDVSKLRIYGANTTNYVELTAQSLTGNRTLSFPDSDGTNGQVLSTNGSGVLSWISPAGSVSSVFGRSGAVVSTAGDYDATKITNAPAGSIAAITVQAAITELDTEKQSASSLAADVRAILLTGISTATNAVIDATDSILVAFGKLQAQISANNTSISSNKADRTNVTQTITAATITGLTTPLVGADATNKTYVDTQIAGASNQWTLSGSDIYRNSGNVGIGTTSPTRPLEVYSNTFGFSGLFYGNNGGGATVGIGGYASSGQVQAFTNNTIATPANLTLQPTGGSVGVGTTNPAFHKMVVAKDLGSNAANYMLTGQHNLGFAIRKSSDNKEIEMGMTDDGVGIIQSHEIGIGYNILALNPVAGNVGIGTTNPTARLHIGGTAGVDGIKFPDGTIQTTANGASSGIVNGTFTGNGAASQSINLGFRPKMVIIKSTGPTYFGQSIAIDGLPDAANQLRTYVNANTYDVANSGNIRITATGFDATGNGNDSVFNNNGSTYYYTAIGSISSTTQWNNGATSSINYTAGNVGIGTTSPTTNLHVNSAGTDNTSIFIQNTSAGGRNFGIYSTGNTSAVGAGKFVISDSSTPRLAIDSSGYVGIGTTSPQTALEVNGGIKVGTQSTCNAATEGTQRYNSTTKNMEFCNGTSWKIIGTGTVSETFSATGNVGSFPGTGGGVVGFTTKQNSNTAVFSNLGTSGIRILKAGKIHVSYNQDAICNGTYSYSYVSLNGSTLIARSLAVPSTYWSGLSSVGSYSVAANDTLTFYVYCASGTFTQIDPGDWSIMSIFWSGEL